MNKKERVRETKTTQTKRESERQRERSPTKRDRYTDRKGENLFRENKDNSTAVKDWGRGKNKYLKQAQAKMRPDCVSMFIEFGAKHVKYMER